MIVEHAQKNKGEIKVFEEGFHRLIAPSGEWKIGKIVNVDEKQTTATVLVSRPHHSTIVRLIKLFHFLKIYF